jgi:hypothetical protein
MFFRFISKVSPIAVLLVFLLAGLSPRTFAQTPPNATAPARTPTDTAKFFYQSLAAKKFREALSVSVFKGALEGLSDGDFNELLPEFEAMAVGADAVEYTGEEVTTDHATVFARVKDDSGQPQVMPIPFMLRNGQWIYGDAETEAAVLKDGKDYFFNIRIAVHETDVREMFQRILKAEIVYSSYHEGAFGDLKTLVAAELLPPDILGTASTGYKYQIVVGKDGKSYYATAEPEKYGRTGRVSFLLENSALSSKDNAGKPLPRVK